MKNQLTSKILKFAFALMFILITSSCSEDNDAMDAAALAQENAVNETLAKPDKVTSTATYSSSITWDNQAEPVCIDTEIIFTLSGWKNGAQLNVKIYDEVLGTWNSIDNFTGQLTSPQSLSYTFPSTGVYHLGYQVSGSAAHGGTNGFVEFDVTAENCAPCTESESDTAYAGNGAGGTDGRGNNAWWYYLDIADGKSDVTADVWRSKSNDIGDVSYNASTKMITITLDDWFLQTDNSESVKWYSYANGALPTNGRPIPGQAPYKGRSLTFSASTDRYYAIHLDVATCE